MLSRIGKSKPANEILNNANRGKLALASACLIIIVLIFLPSMPTIPYFADFKAGPERKADFFSYFHPLIKLDFKVFARHIALNVGRLVTLLHYSQLD
jgi:hypothetical protein